jgi:hypothetical protein
MNNEPVAWFEQDPDMKSIWYQSEQDNPNAIPLYTHPVSKAKDRFPNYESICLQCGTTIYKPAFKTLTDEEIVSCIDESEPDTTDMIRFARAILRKAQE